MSHVAGKVAIVVGFAKGIGAHAALRLATWRERRSQLLSQRPERASCRRHHSCSGWQGASYQGGHFEVNGRSSHSSM